MDPKPATSPEAHATLLRHARFAGSWYPRDPETLADLVRTAWDASTGSNGWTSGSPAGKPDPDCPRGLVLPHPGLAFGLATQARGVRQGLGTWKPSHIIILSPSHYAALPADRLFSAPYTTLETPLARLSHRLPQKLPQGLSIRQEVLDTEHGLECLLPLLSWCFPEADYTLLVCGGSSSSEGLTRMAKTLRSLVDPHAAGSTLLVASSDMSHTGWRFDDPQKRPPDMELAGFANQILKRDRAALEKAGSDPAGLLRQRQDLAPTMCGLIPVLLVQEVLGGSLRLLHQSTSLEAAKRNPEDPEDDTFVTYAAAVWKDATWKT